MDCRLPVSSAHGIFPEEYWRALPFPTPEDLPSPGIEPTTLTSPALAGGFFITMPAGKSNSFSGNCQSIEQSAGDISGNPVVKTPPFYCRQCGFHPWLELRSHMSHDVAKKTNQQSVGRSKMLGSFNSRIPMYLMAKAEPRTNHPSYFSICYSLVCS